MHIEHELAKRPLQSRKAVLQNYKARTGDFRSRLEIHLAERFAEIEMLLRRKCVIAFRAELMMLDIVLLVLAVRHFVERQIGNLCKQVV